MSRRSAIITTLFLGKPSRSSLPELKVHSFANNGSENEEEWQIFMKECARHGGRPSLHPKRPCCCQSLVNAHQKRRQNYVCKISKNLQYKLYYCEKSKTSPSGSTVFAYSAIVVFGPLQVKKTTYVMHIIYSNERCQQTCFLTVYKGVGAGTSVTFLIENLLGRRRSILFIL